MEIDDMKRKEMRLKVEVAEEQVREAGERRGEVKARAEAAEAEGKYWEVRTTRETCVAQEQVEEAKARTQAVVAERKYWLRRAAREANWTK